MNIFHRKQKIAALKNKLQSVLEVIYSKYSYKPININTVNQLESDLTYMLNQIDELDRFEKEKFKTEALRSLIKIPRHYHFW